MISSEAKSKVVSAAQTHKTDTGSAQVQATILTERIKEITAHLKNHAHDNKARRGLIQMVGQRKRHLAYLERTDFEAYKALISKLGLRK